MFPHPAPARDLDAPPAERPPALARWSLGLAIGTAVATYLAAQVDFWRRHRPGVAPNIYLAPQLWQIWVPGLAIASGLALVALMSLRAARRRRLFLSSRTRAD